MHLTPGEEQRNAFSLPKMRALRHDDRHAREDIDADRASNQRSKRAREIYDILDQAMQRIGMGDNGVGMHDAGNRATVIMQERNDRERRELIALAEKDVADAAAEHKAAVERRDLLYAAAQKRQNHPPMYHKETRRDTHHGYH